MTSSEEHLKSFRQFNEDIKEKIMSGLVLERQKIIAFDASEASTNLLEYFLHKKNLIPAGFKVNHNYFASLWRIRLILLTFIRILQTENLELKVTQLSKFSVKRAHRYLDFDFPKKDEIISLMTSQEEFRNILCYGKEKDIEEVKGVINNLNRLIELIKSELGEPL